MDYPSPQCVEVCGVIYQLNRERTARALHRALLVEQNRVEMNDPPY